MAEDEGVLGSRRRSDGGSGGAGAATLHPSFDDRFIAATGHELRTPIAALLAYLEVVRRTSVGRLDPVADDHLAKAIVQARRLAELSDRLYESARLEGGAPVEARDLEFGALLREVAGTAAMIAPRQRIELHPVPPTVVRGDPIGLRAAILELLTNAVVHGASDRPVEVRARRTGAVVEVSIADRGPGVPDDVRARLFEPFAAGRGAPHGGLGLGLYLADRIVGRHGGSLTLEPREAGGTIAAVRLPATTGADNSQEASR